MGAHAKEEGGIADGVCVREGGGGELARNVRRHGLEGGAKISRALEEVIAVGDALPTDGDAWHPGHGIEHSQDRRAVGGDSAREPFLPVIQVIAIGVGVISGAVGWQGILLEPGVRDDGGRRPRPRHPGY